MRRTAPARTTTSATLGPAAVGLVVATAAIIGTLVHPPDERASPSAPPSGEVVRRHHGGTGAVEADGAVSEAEGAVSEAEGALPDGVTVFDDEHPGVANLDPALLRALREAATDAAADGVDLYVNSGWRSPEYQDQLLREAVTEYGSEEEAARWVATAGTSAHVSGDAVDIGPFDATAWLSDHGAEHGLCQIYANESWHYELVLRAIGRGCPPMYADPTRDPRMR